MNIFSFSTTNKFRMLERSTKILLLKINIWAKK